MLPVESTSSVISQDKPIIPATPVENGHEDVPPPSAENDEGSIQDEVKGEYSWVKRGIIIS